MLIRDKLALEPTNGIPKWISFNIDMTIKIKIMKNYSFDKRLP